MTQKLFQNQPAKAVTERLQSVQNKLETILYSLLLLFLPTQLGKHFWPNSSFVLGQRIDYLSPTIYVTDVLIFLLVIALLIKKVICVIPTEVEGSLYTAPEKISLIVCSINTVAKRFTQGTRAIARRLGYARNDKWFLFLFLISFLLLNISFSQSPQQGFYGLLKLGEMGFLTCYTGNILRRNPKRIFFPLTFGIISESVLAIAQFFTQGSLNGIFYYFGERTFTSVTPGIANASINGQLILRPYATFSHPNVLAGYLVVGMSMLIINDQWPVTNIKKAMLFLTLLIGTVALGLTLSRVAVLVWGIVLGFFLIKRIGTRPIPTVVFLCLASYLFFVSPLFPRFFGTSLSDESVVLREQFATDALQMVFAHPLLGVGLHNFLIVLPDFDKNRASIFSIQPVHNIFLLIASETGLIGLWLAVSFVIWLYLRLFRVYKQEQNSKSLVSMILLTEVIVLGSFDHYFLTIQQGQLLLGLVLGFILSIM